MILLFICHRALAMNYAYDPSAWRVEEAYLFGDDFLIAPCMNEGATTVDVYFPALSGLWVHLVSVYVHVAWMVL